MTYANEMILKDIDKKAEEMKQRILSSKSEYPRNANKIYVSNNGCDDNDGKTPETAIATLEKLKTLQLSHGDVVLFERGGLWRGSVNTQVCVTYSAYGEGEKPKIYGNGGTAEGADSWEKTDVPNVWVSKKEYANDVGNILFDGKYYSRKRFAQKERVLPDGRKELTRPDGVGAYTGLCDLKENLQFHHDENDKKVYIYLDKGNPGEVYSSVEMVCRGNCFNLTSGVTIDNLCIKFSGSHGVGGGRAINVRVRNCEIAWCGGSFLTGTTLFGNAVELYGNCDGFYVYDNYIHDIYDTGITHQEWNIPVPAYMHDCRYERNLIEYCYWSIEYVARGEYSDANRMSDIHINDNIMRFAGEGWGGVRAGGGRTGAHIKGWPIESPADTFEMTGNIFDRAKCNYILDCGVSEKRFLPEMKDNTYVQYEGNHLGYFGINDPRGRGHDKDNGYLFDDKIDETIENVLCDKNAKVYTIKE